MTTHDDLNGSSDADEEAASLDRDSHVPKGTVASRDRPAGRAPRTPRTAVALSDVARSMCQAIKRNGTPCEWEASKGGQYAGRFCRLHATEAGKAAKRRGPVLNEQSVEPVEEQVQTYTCGTVGPLGPCGYTSDNPLEFKRIVFSPDEVVYVCLNRPRCYRTAGLELERLKAGE